MAFRFNKRVYILILSRVSVLIMVVPPCCKSEAVVV